MEEKARQGKDINFIFRDAAGSTEKQIKDIRALMDFGVDLLIVSPDGSNSLNGILKKCMKKYRLWLLVLNRIQMIIQH